MTKNVKDLKTADDLTLDVRNANAGTARGRSMVKDSLKTLGAGRSVLADKHGNVLAGNKTVEAARELGLPIRVVRTDGRELVVVQRENLDALSDDDRARLMAYADNRTSEVGLQWDPSEVAIDKAAGIDLSAFWTDEEMTILMADLPDDDEWDDAADGLPDGERGPFRQMTFTLYADQVVMVKQALQTAINQGSFEGPNKNSNGNALARICTAYLEEHGKSEGHSSPAD